MDRDEQRTCRERRPERGDGGEARGPVGAPDQRARLESGGDRHERDAGAVERKRVERAVAVRAPAPLAEQRDRPEREGVRAADEVPA